MAKSRKHKGPKLPFGITEEFIDRMNSVGPDGRKALVVEIQKGIDDSLTYLNTKQEILDAKAELDILVGPTRDTLKSLRNRNKYLIEQMKRDSEI